PRSPPPPLLVQGQQGRRRGAGRHLRRPVAGGRPRPEPSPGRPRKTVGRAAEAAAEGGGSRVEGTQPGQERRRHAPPRRRVAAGMGGGGGDWLRDGDDLFAEDELKELKEHQRAATDAATADKALARELEALTKEEARIEEQMRPA